MLKDEEQVGSRTFSYEILDLERTLQERLSRQPITIDFKSEFGESIPCLKAPNIEADYTSCLAMIRGEILYKIYKRYGARLLERNVRSFLQARPKVNKGIRETIVKMPDRFLAYNNGISATAAHIDFYDAPGGSCVINRITDLQIVNGGQTTAMIYQTHKIAPDHVSKIYVPAKITMVKDPDLLDSIVPEIARCANSQNKISDSDFLANDVFHTTLQDLSRLTAARLPESSQLFYWYYERARGQYAEERSRANRKQFESKYPPDNMFTKTDLAKFENSWHQLPHLVSRGAQKNFTEFDRRFVKKHKVAADENYFRDLVAKAILFREANGIIKKQQFGGHVNSILTFTIALLCRLLESDSAKLNLERIWKQQALSTELRAALEKLSIHVHKAIMDSAGTQNVGEWCKKEECWHHIRDLEVSKPILCDSDVVPLPRPEVTNPINDEDTEETDDAVFSQSVI